MSDAYPQITALVQLSVEHVAAGPEDEQRYLELNFSLDRAVERDVRYRELREFFERQAEQAPDALAWAWWLAAGLGANLMGDTLSATRALERARPLLEAAGRSHSAVMSFLHSELARAHYHRGEHAAGVEAATRGLQLACAANSRLAEAYARHYLGLISIRLRDYDYARRHLSAAHDLFDRMHQRQGRARVLDSLASLEMERGRYAPARQMLEESLGIKQDLRDLRGQALTSGNLAQLYTALGDYEQAMHYLDRERELTSRVGDERNATNARIQLGELHLGHDRPELAREELLAACELATSRGDARLGGYASFALAEAERRLGRPTAANDAVAAACAYFSASDDLLMRHRADLRRALYLGEDLQSPAVQGPLDALRAAGATASLARALFEVAGFFRNRGRVYEVAGLYAEALDVAEPAQADQLAAVMRARAASAEGRAWVDAMLAAQIQKSKLEQAYGELRRAETLRDSLTQMIVHDLMNPLAAITPGLQAIQMGALTPDQTQECLQTAIEECGYLVRMIEDLNDVGRMQHQGRMDLHLEPLDLRDLVQDVAGRLQGRAAERGMKIVFENAPAPLPLVDGDPNKLRRVLENLLANAVKYGRPPEDTGRPLEIRLRLAHESRDPEEGQSALRVEVLDFGPGIPLAEADRVFEPYYQAEAGRKRKAGVGLGLAFSRMVVEAHAGNIWTEPNQDGGSIFAFRIPLKSTV